MAGNKFSAEPVTGAPGRYKVVFDIGGTGFVHAQTTVAPEKGMLPADREREKLKALQACKQMAIDFQAELESRISA